jgi:hypothetical protein
MYAGFFMYLILILQFISIGFIFFSFFYKKYLFSPEIINKFNVLTGVLTATSLLLSFFLFRNQYAGIVNSATIQMIDRGFNDVNKVMVDYYDKCPNFISSLNFKFLSDNQEYQHNNQKSDDQVTVNFISNKIFQSVEDFITTNSLTLTENHAWFATFLSYFTSKQLRDKWVKLKYNYGPLTHSYVNLIIKSINENKFKNADDVTTFSQKITKSNEYLNILKSVNRNATLFN